MNVILATDSYKLGHWTQYPKNTTGVYSYFESRKGAMYDETVFVGLQHILKDLEGVVVTQKDVAFAAILAKAHFGDKTVFNFDGWMHVVNEHGGRLPVRIKAVPEGTVVPVGNVLMTVENTCPDCFWLTNALESLLTHVWYPSTVASLSRGVKKTISRYLDLTAETQDGLPFMLHDFGYRGAATHEAAALGGFGHLVNFLGTDTVPAMVLAMESYGAKLDGLAYSVRATEHSVMTAMGPNGEEGVVQQLLNDTPTGILSVVADSYDYYNFVENFVGDRFKEQIMARDGVFVVRPDSVTKQHDTPENLVAWTLESLWKNIGGTTNSKGFKVLDNHVRILWGDGIGPDGIELILDVARSYGFSAENLVFGMGGGLLQKVNRDTQRFAFKSSAQRRDGMWHDVFKRPLDISKTSKAGRLSLIPYDHTMVTVAQPNHKEDLLVTVFENGEILTHSTLEEVRERAALPAAKMAEV